MPNPTQETVLANILDFLNFRLPNWQNNPVTISLFTARFTATRLSKLSRISPWYA